MSAGGWKRNRALIFHPWSDARPELGSLRYNRETWRRFSLFHLPVLNPSRSPSHAPFSNSAAARRGSVNPCGK